MTNIKLRIDSDFIDYYDYLSTPENNVVTYIRKYSNTLSKGKALSELRKFGVKTVETAAVRELASRYDKLVVYTDVTKHKGEGKIVMTSSEALLMYPTRLASPYYEGTGGATNKFLQLGSRRFRVILENISPLKTGKVIMLDEIQPDYNYLVGLPIFSIDYISTQNGMIAVDFNTVQELYSLGMQQIMNPQDVINEIYNALVTYGTTNINYKMEV